MGFDVEGFSRLNTRRQSDVQSAMDRMFRISASAAQLDYEAIGVATTGDGALMVLPADVDMVALIVRFIPELEVQLRAYNDDRVPETRIRMRVAVHTDAIRTSTYGYAGPALVVLSRLLDSDPVRAGLKDHPAAQLALIVSEPVFRKACLSGLGGIRPEQYAEVTVDIPSKGFREPAYVHVPGQFLDGGGTRDPGGRDEPRGRDEPGGQGRPGANDTPATVINKAKGNARVGVQGHVQGDVNLGTGWADGGR